MNLIDGKNYTCKVNLAAVKKRENLAPYLRLVKRVMKNAEQHRPLIVGESEFSYVLRSWAGDILGDVFVRKDEVYDIQNI